jgi:hypothetical protein
VALIGKHGAVFSEYLPRADTDNCHLLRFGPRNPLKRLLHGVFTTAAEGQVDNFTTLLEQQIPRLRRYAFALHRSDRCRADDLVQDTLVRAIAKQHLWQPGTNLPGWLSTLMHHQNVNDVRRSVWQATASAIRSRDFTTPSLR